MSISNLLTFRVMPKAKTSQEIKDVFGRWFQSERENRGISQKYVADKADMTVTQLSRIENGQSGTKRDTVILLAHTIGVDEESALGVFYGGVNAKAENDLLSSVRYELHDAENWSDKQKAEFLQVLKITVAGIKAKGVEKKEVEPDIERPAMRQPNLKNEMKNNLEDEFGETESEIKRRKVA